MGFFSDRRIRQLQRELDEARKQLAASEERLAAETAVNSQMNEVIDEALELQIRLIDDLFQLEAKLEMKSAILAELKHKLTGTHRELCDLDPEILAVWERGGMHSVREAGE